VRYEFDEYSLLATERLLLKRGERVALKPKVFDTLLALVRNPGRLLSKEELIGLIWPDSFVEESNLSQNVFTLRKVLGESPQDHRFIVTVPGYGYRFVSRVREVAGEAGPGAGAETEARPPVGSLAVLPLKTLLPVAGDDYLGLVIADTLITQLGASGVTVRPTSTVLKYAEAERDPLEVGRTLRVDAVLDGTVRRTGDRLRVNVQLVASPGGQTLWANGFEASVSDFAAIEDAVAEQVAASLRVELERGAGVRPRPKAPKDLDVYQTYVKGRFFWEKRTEEGVRVGLACARAVLEAQPELPLGYIGLADSYLLMGEFLYLSPQEAFPPAREAARKALALDPALGEAHASLAESTFFHERNWADAERYYRDAIKLSPDYAAAHHWYTWFLIAMGRYEDAAEQIGQAQMIDPGSLVHNTIVGLPHYYVGRYEQAIKQFRSTLEVEPGYQHARYYLGSALVHAGRHEEAISEFETMVAAEPIQQAVGLLGYCYAVAGRADDARATLSRLDELGRERFVSAYVRAFVHMGLGERERALEHLERACDEGEPWVVFLNVDPFFRDLRGEPRFGRLLERLRFPG
jgi:DNA-binding winged helix-turn-helix (wHTH) protein/tetratricopeptide (TPR) repeat protein